MVIGKEFRILLIERVMGKLDLYSRRMLIICVRIVNCN